jgi:hypothetical protein
MTDPPPDWQVKVTPRDRGDLRVVKQRLESAGLRSIRRWRSLLLGAGTEEQALQVAAQVRELPLPPVAVRTERVSRVWKTLHAWFRGDGDAGGDGGLGGGDGPGA